MAAYSAGSSGPPPTTTTTTQQSSGGSSYAQTPTTQQTSSGGSSYTQTTPKLQQLFEARKNKLPLINPVVDAINQITERAIQNQIAKANEFYYENGKPVKAGTTYHIHYTTDLGEYFMSGGVHNSTSKLMFPLKYDVSQFTYYNTLNEQSPLKLSSQVVSPKEEDYKKGSYKRYFAKQANDKNQPTFEVSKQDFQSSPLYNYVQLRWYVTGAKNYVYSQNIKQIRIASATIVTIKKLLTPFQFYRFEENLSDADLLRRRLANMMDLSNYNTVTQSNQNTSSDGTAGGYDGNINLDGDGNYLGNDSNNSELDADGNEIGSPDIC